MKRRRESNPEDSSDDDEPRAKIENTESIIRASDEQLWRDLRDKYGRGTDDELNADITRQQREITQKYYKSYIKKLLEKIPIGKTILQVTDIDNIDDFQGFFRMFSAAKTVVHANMELKKRQAFNRIFDMLIGLVGRYVHDKVVSTMIAQYVTKEVADEAFYTYQRELASDDDSTALELQCVTYLIQTELEKDSSFKVQHPIMNRFSQQAKALSSYVLSLLSAIAGSNHTQREWTEHHAKSDERFVEMPIIVQDH